MFRREFVPPPPPGVGPGGPSWPPPPPGPEPGEGPRGWEAGPLPEGSQDHAALELEHAYQAIARAASAWAGTQTAGPAQGQLLDLGKALYGRGIAAYGRQAYGVAAETARAATAAADAAVHLAESVGANDVVPGLQLPPAAGAAGTGRGASGNTVGKSQAAHELVEAYRATASVKDMAAGMIPDGETDALIAIVQTLYAAAYREYEANRSARARQVGCAVRRGADSVRHLLDATRLRNADLGDEPVPPAPEF